MAKRVRFKPAVNTGAFWRQLLVMFKRRKTLGLKFVLLVLLLVFDVLIGLFNLAFAGARF